MNNSQASAQVLKPVFDVYRSTRTISSTWDIRTFESLLEQSCEYEMAKRIESQDITCYWAGRRVEAARLCQRTHLKIHLVIILITLFEIYHLVVIFINDGEYTLYTYMRMIPHIIMIVMIMEMTIFHNKAEEEDNRW